MSSNKPADLNLVTFVGTVHRAPLEKVLTSGEQVVNFDLCIRGEDRRDVLPLSWFEAPRWVLDVEVGESLVVTGRMRRQWFGSGSNFTDVVVQSVVPARSPAKVRKVLGQAMATLQSRAS